MDERVGRRAIDSPAKHELLKMLLQKAAHKFNAFALSSAQQRLWFLDQFQPNSPLYNLPAAVRLSGPLNLLALAHSLAALVQRHEALRTTFTVVAEQPVQRIATAVRVPLPVLDLRALPPATRAVEAQQLARREAQRPFDLAQDQLLRTTVLRLDADEHVLLVTMHHIIADGWSIGVLVRDLAALYAAAVASQPATLPALPIQYVDYAAWQREQLHGGALATHMAYWQAQLVGAPPVLELPSDHARPATPTIRGGRHPLVVPEAVTAELAALSQRAQATLFMTLLAAFQILLARYADQQDLVVGTPIANRTRAETEGVIGCFVNTLVLRTDLSGNPTFHELLARVRSVCLAAYTHQSVPFEHLVQVLQTERDLRHMPLVQVVFALQNAPMPPLDLVGLSVSMQDVDSGTAKFDLTLNLEERPNGLVGWFEYAADLFDPPTIARMAGHWLTLLTGVVAEPEQRIATLPLLSAAEQEQLLALWPVAPAARVDGCLHQLFAAQADHSPDAVALVFHRPTTDDQRPTTGEGTRRPGDQETQENTTTQSPTPNTQHPIPNTQHLTYAELNARADQLARHLRALGVGPEVCVGLCLERSLDLVVGLLGILKTGAAYVPLDPAYPAERLAFVLNDARATVLLTQRAIYDLRWTMDDLEGSSAAIAPASVICLDTDWPQIAGAEAPALVEQATPANLAYVIYTSGSTGTPKGVLVSHANVVRLLSATQPWLHATAGDVWTLFHSAAFDFSVWELWGALSCGGRLVIVSREVTRAPDALTELLDHERVTVLNQTPSAFYPLLPALLSTRHSLALRRVIFGGEALDLARLRPWFESLGAPTAQLINMYGITETTVHVTVRAISAADVRTAPGSLIGVPLADLRAYVLDPQQQPAPLGVPGELYVGGAGVARGYLGRPALTAERFVPNPFAADTQTGRHADRETRRHGDRETRRHGDTERRDEITTQSSVLSPQSSSRLYRTGDRVRCRADGTLEYLGRLDQQVKLRGYRIELGEIEAVLLALPVVQDAVVLAREDQPGDRRLVAYVVLRTEAKGLSGTEETTIPALVLSPQSSVLPALRAFLAERLPDYMVPSAFVIVDALPLTSSGKIDRRALPAPSRPELDDSFVAPRTPQEELLAGIWGDVLGQEHVGVYDNFFALGGHSLLATQLIVRVRETFQVELPVRRLFESPTVAALAEQIALARQDAPAIVAPPIRPVARSGKLPLAFAQQRLWFVHQLDPASAAYTIAAVIRLTGPLNLTAFVRSLTAIVERHEILRTTFPDVDGDPVQSIGPVARVALPVLDLRGLPPAVRALEAQRLARCEAQRPFDLATDRLLRTTMLRLDADEHELLLTMHHIIADGWSSGIFVRDLAALYTAFVNNRPAQLPELPIQYADFAQWQREWLQGSVLESQLAYWRAQLSGSLPNLELIGDRPRPPVQTFRGAHHAITIPAHVTAALIDLSRRERVTLFMTLLATFTTLLARYAQQDDIPVGTTVANRGRSAVEGLIGLFINTLVLRADLAGNPRFRDLLARVREVALEAYAHQDVPFEQLVEALQPVRDMSRNPLVQVIFVLQNAPMPAMEFAGLRLRPVAIDSGTSQFDLTLNLVDRQGSLDGWFEYNTDLFDAATIVRMASHFQTLLAGVVAHPEWRLAGLPLLSESEQRQILVEWNATARAYPLEQTLHELFAAQAIETPDGIAVVFEGRAPRHGDREAWRAGDTEAGSKTAPQSSVLSPQSSLLSPQHLSCGELERRANQLAHRLRALGVGPEVRAGICMERSLELVIALLGILKAGGAYVPLDPTYPAERLTFMLADARVSVLLTTSKDQAFHSSFVVDLAASVQTPVIDLHADWPTIVAAPAYPPANRTYADNLAYAIYTSGSTGQPKGVLGTHRATLNCFYWMWTTYPFASGEICAQKTSLSFGDSIQELFGPLLRGVPLVLIPEEVGKDPERLSAALARHAVTRLVLVPALLHAILDTPVPLAQTLAALTLWIASGEPLPAALVSRFAARLPHARLVNMYGASELANDVTWIELSPPVAEPVPIGWTVANMQCYLLDRHMRPVPQGAVGELYVGGAGLNRGYLERPHLTAERFVPNPFDGDTETRRHGDRETGDMEIREASHHSAFCILHSAFGDRLYRTGDLARYRADGALVFMGRSDQQVKVRGHRIELSEIAAALEQHPLVREVVVVAQADREQPGEKQLVAYLVPQPGAVLRSSELRRFAQQSLPEYMLPAAWAVLEALPLTPSGKVDRRALPALDQLPAEQDDSYIAPRTPTEELLASSWADVLGRARVGIYDNFFALGGHSLLVTRVIARVRDAFEIELPLRYLFETPTVAALAERIDAIRQEAQGLSAPPIQPIPRDGEIPLSFAQQRFWFLDQLAPGSAAYTIPAAIQVRGPLDVAALWWSISAIVRRHEALRTTFVTRDGRPVQLIAAAQPLALPLIDLSTHGDVERLSHARRLAHAEVVRPFDLARGPLLRAALIRLSGADHLLLITTHHIVFDGSHSIFFRELAALYTAGVTGIASDLAELPIQYADFAHWQRIWFSGAVRETQLSYWKQQLGQQIAPLDLPTDRPRPPLPSFRGARHSFNLSNELTAALNVLSRQVGVTLFMTLLAGLQTLLARYSGQGPIAVGTPVATRSRAVTEHLIGCFVNTLVMSADLSDNPPFEVLLRQVREVALGAYTHMDLPFEMLVEALQTTRDLSRNPLYQVMFVLQHAPFQGLTFPELSLSPLEVDTGSARFDLLLALTEHEHGLAGSIEYATDLFDAATIARLVGHFETLLEGFVRDPALRLSDVLLLTAAERQQMLDAWNATDAAYARDLCIHQLFEAQAARIPDAIAVICDGRPTTNDLQTNPQPPTPNPQPLTPNTQHLSYGALNGQANQVAWQLAELGVGRGTTVAVVLDRSPMLIPALLGILKAGGAYVPLEPSFPSARIQWIMATLKVAYVVTQVAQLARGIELYASVPTLAHVLCMDSAPADLTRAVGGPQLWMRAKLERQPEANLPSRASAADLAYIIFTSGSTGTPKGVMVCHQPVINLIEWVNHTCAISSTDQVLFVTSVCFDLSVYDIFGLLAAGAAIRVVPDAAVRDPQRLLALLEHEPITLWDSAPATLQQLAPFFPQPGPARAASRLRLALLSGDWIPVGLPDQLRRSFPNAAVLSLGGATEATVWSNYYLVGVVPPAWTSIPYGRPIQNARYYILDEQMQPVPIGVAGELYIGGACLCLGYAAEPVLTAERFVPNPFAADTETRRPGDTETRRHGDTESGDATDTQSSVLSPQSSSRLYRTGDQARFWPDGTIIFLGRRDQQVKIRGFRIELGEIETVLRQHASVRDAVVVAREDGLSDNGHTDKRLVAYIGLRTEQKGLSDTDSSVLSPQSSVLSELRAFLRTLLPEYMLPAAFVILDALPTTPNGKLDRKALPAPDQVRPMLNEQFVAPRTSTEQALADIWTQVLNLDRVGVHDNFFEVGGDSIMSIQIVARAHQAGLPLSPQQLFQHQTIAELSTVVDPAAVVPVTTVVQVDGPADFALAQLDQDELDAALGQITFEEGSY